jgi:hypothetical protein
MLYIPTNLVVTKATCDLLRLQIPLYFRTNPLQLFLDNVVLHLEEPDVVPPAPCKVAQMWAVDAEEARAPQSEAERKRAKQNMDILYNMTYEVKTLTLLVTTKSNRNTVMRFDVRNTRVESVNRDWRVVDLASSRDLDAAAQSETLYKLTRIKSISISISDPASGVDTVLADNAPAQYRQTASYSLATGQLIASRYEFIFERLDFQWDVDRYQLLLDAGSSLGTVFSKEVPVDPNAPKAEVYNYHVAYEIFIAEWSMVFDAGDLVGAQRRTKTRRRRRESQPLVSSNPVHGDEPASPRAASGSGVRSVTTGVKLAGVRWKFVWSPGAKKRVAVSELDDADAATDGPPDSEIDVCESLVQLTLPSFSCTAIGRPIDASMRFPALLSQIDSTQATKAKAAASFASVERGAQQVLNMRVLEEYYQQMTTGPRKLTRRPKPVNPALIKGSAAVQSMRTLNSSPLLSREPSFVVSDYASKLLLNQHQAADEEASAKLEVAQSQLSVRFTDPASIDAARRVKKDEVPLLAVSFVQRWRASQEKAARTTNEVRIVISSVMCVFDRTALDRLALFFGAKPRAPASNLGATPPRAVPAPALGATPPRDSSLRAAAAAGAAAAASTATTTSVAPAAPPLSAGADDMTASDARSMFRAQGQSRRSQQRGGAAPAAAAGADTLSTPPTAASVPASDMWASISRRFVSGALPPALVPTRRASDVGSLAAAAAAAAAMAAAAPAAPTTSASAAAPDDTPDPVDVQAEAAAAWAASTRVFIDIYDTHFVVPDIPGAGQFSNMSIDYSIEHMLVTTRPSWNSVPKLDSELEILNRDSDVVSLIRRDESTTTADRTCFQLRLVGVSCVLRSFPSDALATDNEHTITPVLEPATINLYGRFARKGRAVTDDRSRLELMLDSTNINVTVTARQYEYFLFASKLYAQWSSGIAKRAAKPAGTGTVAHIGGVDKYTRRQMRQKLRRSGSGQSMPSSPAPSAGSVDHADDDNDDNDDDDDDDDDDDNNSTTVATEAAFPAKRATLLTAPAPDVKRSVFSSTLGASARYAFGLGPRDSVRTGSAGVAEPVADAPPPRLTRTASIDHSAASDFKSRLAAIEANRALAEQAAKAAAPAPKPRVNRMRVAFALRIENSTFLVPLSWSDEANPEAQLKPSKVAFSAMQVALDVDDDKRCVVARLAGAEAIGLDHPSLPAYVSLIPRARNTSFFANQSSYRLLEVRYVRLAVDADAPANVAARAYLTAHLRNASLIFVAKDAKSLSVENIVGSLRNYATELLGYFSEHNREVKETLHAKLLVDEQAPASTARNGAAAAAPASAQTLSSDLSTALECAELDVLIYDSSALSGREQDLERHLPAASVMPRTRFSLGADSSHPSLETKRAERSQRFDFRKSSGAKVDEDTDTDDADVHDDAENLAHVAAEAKLKVALAEAERGAAEHAAAQLKHKVDELERQSAADAQMLREALTKIALLQADLDMLHAPPEFAAALYTTPPIAPPPLPPARPALRQRVSTALEGARRRRQASSSKIDAPPVDEAVADALDQLPEQESTHEQEDLPEQASEHAHEEAAATSRFARLKARLPSAAVTAAPKAKAKFASLKTRLRGGSAAPTTSAAAAAAASAATTTTTVPATSSTQVTPATPPKAHKAPAIFSVRSPTTPTTPTPTTTTTSAESRD